MEPIEQWRKEFISTSKVNFNHLSDEYFRLDKSGNFEDDSTFFRFEGFCQAKRSQPVVEIIEQAHMAGQADAGVDPSYSNAQAYAKRIKGE